MLAGARSELMKQECKVDTLNTCIRELQREISSQRLELEDAIADVKNLEESKFEYRKNWS